MDSSAYPLSQLSDSIYQAAGEEFNIDSPKQLSRILFEVMGLKPEEESLPVAVTVSWNTVCNLPSPARIFGRLSM